MDLNLPRYEKIWLWFGGGSLVIFLVIMGFMAVAMGLNPADSMRSTVAPEEITSVPPFDQPGLYEIGPGEYRATIVSFAFGYEPNVITIPKGSTVHFEIASQDVIHSYTIVDTVANLMVVPGHVTEYSYTFNQPGEYLVLCNEYCGIGHQLMQGRIIVEDV